MEKLVQNLPIGVEVLRAVRQPFVTKARRGLSSGASHLQVWSIVAYRETVGRAHVSRSKQRLQAPTVLHEIEADPIMGCLFLAYRIRFLTYGSPSVVSNAINSSLSPEQLGTDSGLCLTLLG